MIYLAVITLYAIFSLFSYLTFNKYISDPYYYIVLTGFISALILAYRRKTIPLFYVNMLITAAFMYSVQWSIGPDYMQFSNKNSKISFEAAAVFITHIVAVTIAASVTARRAARDRPGRPIGLPTATIATIAALAMIAAIAMVVGLQFYTRTRIELILMGVERGALGTVLEYFSKSLLYVLCAMLILSVPRIGRNIVYVGLIALIFLIAVTVSNPTNTPRFISLSGVFLVLVAIAYRIRAYRHLPSYITIAPLILILALPVTSALRRGTGVLSLETVYDLFTSLEFSSFQLFLDAITYFSDRAGQTAHTLTAIFIMVPRGLWPGKEEAVGNEVAAAEDYVIDNVSLPSFTNFYIDYGAVGLVIGSLALGWFFAKVDLPLAGRPDFRNRRQIYGLMILAMIPIIARGDMSTACIASYAYFASYEIVRVLLRLTLGRPAETPPRPILPPHPPHNRN